MVSKVVKRLTRNDLGLTGGHQAGICVPFKIVKLGFFPELDSSIKNPRLDIPFSFAGQTIVFSYVYYNGRLIGDGTRNEYRSHVRHCRFFERLLDSFLYNAPNKRRWH